MKVEFTLLCTSVCQEINVLIFYCNILTLFSQGVRVKKACTDLEYSLI